MALGDMENRPRSHQSSRSLKPLEFVASGQKLKDFPQQEALSLTKRANIFESFLHKLKDDNEFGFFLHKLKDANEDSATEDDWLAIDDLCQRFELRRLVDGASEHLQAAEHRCQGMLPQAAERLHATRRQCSADARGQKLALSGQSLNGPGRRKPANMCDVAWPSNDCQGAAPPEDSSRDVQEGNVGKKRHRSSRSGTRKRDTPGSQSNGSVQRRSKRLTYIGCNAKPLNTGAIDELTAKMVGCSVDLVKVEALENKPPAADVARKKFSSPRPKRCLAGSSDTESKVTPVNGYNREGDTHLLSPDSLGYWATQSPSLAIDNTADLPMESSITRSVLREQNFSGAPPPCSPNARPGSSPSVLRGRPPMGRAHSTPQLVADGAKNYLDFCHQVPAGHDTPLKATVPLADAVDGYECDATPTTRTLVTGPWDPRDPLPETFDSAPVAAMPEIVRASSAVGSRPNSRGTTNSSMAGAAHSCRSAGRRGMPSSRGMPLSAHTVPISAGATSHADNLFGVVSRSRNFSQGSPTELGSALASSVPQPARSKSSTVVRSSSAAAGLRLPGSAWSGPPGIETPPRGARLCVAGPQNQNRG